MSNKGKQIGELLNTTSASASDITKPLKAIGDGSMLDGVRNIHDFAFAEGEKRGILKGGFISAIACGAMYLIPKGIKLARKKIAEKKEHAEMGEKIYSAFSEELDAQSNKETAQVEDNSVEMQDVL